MAAIRKVKGQRNIRWEARVRKSNTPTRSKTFSTKSDAQNWATKIERAIDLGCWNNFQQDALKIETLGNLLNKYLLEVSPQKRGFVQEESRIQIILNDPITDIPLDKLSPIHLARYRDHRIKVVQGSTVAKELGVISHAIEVGRREWGAALTNNPVKDIRKPKLPKPRDRRFIEEKNEQ